MYLSGKWWNSLPHDLELATRLNVFKRRVNEVVADKTYTLHGP